MDGLPTRSRSFASAKAGRDNRPAMTTKDVGGTNSFLSLYNTRNLVVLTLP